MQHAPYSRNLQEQKENQTGLQSEAKKPRRPQRPPATHRLTNFATSHQEEHFPTPALQGFSLRLSIPSMVLPERIKL